MISSARNVSRDYNLSGRKTVQGQLLDNCFEKNIKNQHEKLLNRADMYGLHFQGDGAKINNTALLNILDRGGYLPVSVKNIMDCTGHITGGHNKDAKFVAGVFFDPMNDLDPEKRIVYLHMFYGSSVCRKAKNILKVVYPIMSCISVADHTYHNVFKGWVSIEEITRLCR